MELYFFALPQQSKFKGLEHLRVHAPAGEEVVTGLGLGLTSQIEEAALAITETLTDDHRAYLLQGGRVLWLAEHADALQTNLPGLKISPRQGHVWQGDWASSFMWLCQDEMFTGLPVDGVVDFAFADLTPEHVITGLAPREFALAVHAGLFVGWLHRAVALIAERQLGAGRLLISTFRLREHLQTHPVAAWMFRDLLKHIIKS